MKTMSAKEDDKVKFQKKNLYFKRRTTKKETSTRKREKMIEEITRTKTKDATLLKKILVRMMMK